jgi:hypothetical protein
VMIEEVDPFGQPDVPQQAREKNPYAGIPDPLTGRKRRWVRVSTISRTIANEYLLNLWMRRMVAKGMALRPDLCARMCSLENDEDREAMNEIADTAMEVAKASQGANNGTALHDFTKLFDMGKEVAPPTLAWTKDITGYATTLHEWGFRVVPGMVERTVCIPELGIIGTFDRLLEHVRTGRLYIGDLKTAGKIHFGWGEIAIQLALYSRGAWLWDKQTRTWSEMSQVGEINQDRAVVMHVKIGTGKCQLHRIKIDAGWDEVATAMRARAYNNRKDLAELINPPVDWGRLLREASTQDELSKIFYDCSTEGEWNDDLEAIGRARLRWIEAQQNVAVSA